MRNDLTEFLAPRRREPPGESVARAARDRSAHDMSRQREASGEDGTRPRFTVPDNADRAADRAADAARGSSREAPERKNAPPGTSDSAGSQPAPFQTGTSRAVLMRAQGGQVEKAGDAEPTGDVARMLRALAGQAEVPKGAEAEGDQDAAADADAEGAKAASQIQVALNADGQEADRAADQDNAGDNAGDDPSGDGDATVLTESQSADPDAPVSDESADGTDMTSPVRIPGEPADVDQAQADETQAGEAGIEAAIAAASGKPASENASQTARSATADRGNASAMPVAGAGDSARATQAAGPGATATAAASQAAASQASASQASAMGDGQSGADADPQDGGEPGGGDAEAGQTSRSARGGEDRSTVAQEALRRALGGEAGSGRAAMAPGNGDNPAGRMTEQAMTAMQRGAEAGSALAKDAAHAAAEATSTANGQSSAANQAGSATSQTNGAVLINTPISAVPMALGMKAMGGASRFEIRLDPAELGRVAVSLDIDDEGTVKARLVVDRVETLQLLQRDARTLERAFEQAGLKTSEDGIEMSLRDDRADRDGDGNAEDEDGGAGDDARRRAGDGEENGLGAAEIRALARETLLARQAMRQALGGVDLSI